MIARAGLLILTALLTSQEVTLSLARADLKVRPYVRSFLVFAQAPGETPGANQAAPAATGVIRGRITAAETERPLRRAQVTLTARELGAPRPTNTGLDGRYEFKDLPPGRYTVSVTRSGYLSLRYGQRRPLEQARPVRLEDKQTLHDIDLVLPRMGVITGRVLDDGGEPIAGVLVQALRPAWVEGRRQLVIAGMTSGFQGTDETGQYRITGLPPGNYYVKASTRETWTVAADGKRALMGFAPTYVPATINPSEAQLVEVGVGQRVTSPDIFLIPGRTASISGSVFDSRGRPLAGRTVALGQRFLRETPGGGGSNTGSAPVGADGSFTFRNLTPGEYQLSITTGNLRAGEGETAQLNVVVDGVDLENVRLTTTAGWSATGRIVTEDGVAPSFSREAMQMGAATVLQVSGTYGVGTVMDDWTFSVKTVIGAARLWATVPEGWMVKAIRHRNRDITSTLVELKSGESLSEVEVIVTNRITTVSGLLADDRGQPFPNGTVVIFPEDTERWGDQSAFVRTDRPDQDGKYEIKGLPPGDYYAVALDYVQQGIWNDPEFLESVRRFAERFTLVPGGSHALSLKVSKP